MKEVLMMKEARKLVDVCGKVRPGEKVLILSDFAKVSIVQAIAAAVRKKMPKRSYL